MRVFAERRDTSCLAMVTLSYFIDDHVFGINLVLPSDFLIFLNLDPPPKEVTSLPFVSLRRFGYEAGHKE